MLIEEIIREYKRTHLDHIEDTVMFQGKPGAQSTVAFYKDILSTLRGESSDAVKVSVKWDGAPAVVVGTDPSNGRFFVGTKAVFNQTPKINYTKQDIADNHGTEALGQKLLKCLVHLSKLNIKGVYQGDMMFTDDSLKSENINGKPHVIFKPNEITYAVPQDSDLAKQIQSAKVGVVFHTTYTGDSLADMSAQGGADVSEFGSDSSVWYDNADYKDVSGTATFTAEETAEFSAEIGRLEQLLEKVPANLDAMLSSNSFFKKFFEMYINDQVKKGVLPSDVNAFIQGFVEFFTARKEAEKATKKTQRAISSRDQQIQDMNQYISSIKAPLSAALEFYKQAQKMKSTVMKKLDQASSIGTFDRTENGLEVTAPEGYVAVGRDGSAVKLVDRLTFSRRNLSKPKNFD